MKQLSVLCLRLVLLFGVSLATVLGRSSTQEIERIANREANRRQAAVRRGETALNRARTMLMHGNVAKAHREFRTALKQFPNAIATEALRSEAIKGFSYSGIQLAEREMAKGRSKEAEAICREILSPGYDPAFRPAIDLLARLRRPTALNPTSVSTSQAKIEEVRGLLSDAENYYQSGRFDLAFKRYEQVLNLDPYNAAARRGQERINLARTRYGEEAFKEARSRQLEQVQKSWEEPVRQFGPTAGAHSDAFSRDATAKGKLQQKLNTIIIPRIEFRDASVREAFDFLRQQAEENDPEPGGRRGVDIVLRLTSPSSPADAPGNSPVVTLASAAKTGAQDMPIRPSLAPATAPFSDARITLTLNEIPLGEALRYVAIQAGLKLKIEPYAISIIPINEQNNDLLTKEYRVPPSFISGSLNPSVSSLNQPGVRTVTMTGTGKDTQETTGGRLLVNREGAKEFLENQGVSFAVAGSSANFLPQTSRLIVRNTADNLELVDAIVEQANVAGPRQVEIEAKFVEITQNNLKELGFDWLLGPFNVNSKGIAISGGTSGTGNPVNQPDYPFPIDGLHPVTAGNRSGNLAINGSAIDSLLLGGVAGPALAPGIFGIGGLLTDPQFQLVMRALNQKKGVDLLSAPRVTTKSGQRALIEIVREFRYPTQFDPPQIPQTIGAANRSDTTIVSLGGGSSVPVTPNTPTNFETRNTGVTLEVEPVVGPDGVTIDLNLVPQVVEFEGFINYGSPILAPSSSFLDTVTGGLVSTPQNVITSNVINQPIFSTRKVTTSVSVWDGQTVVLGGLMREDVQKTQDRTPILGGIPVVGRLFRTNAEQHIKRNLIIFVTARLVNPGGQHLRSREDLEESYGLIDPPVLPKVPYSKK